MDGPQVSIPFTLSGTSTIKYLGKAVTSKHYCSLQGPFNFKDTLGAIITCANGIVMLFLHPRYSWGDESRVEVYLLDMGKLHCLLFEPV